MPKAKFDIKSEATRTLHAGVGAADLAVEAVKEVVAEAQKKFAEAQKSVAGYEFEPKALREQATTVFTARVEELSTEAKARRTAIEKRVAELQDELQSLVTENVGTATGTFEELVKRGETVVAKLRNQPAKPAAATTAATTTTAKSTAAKTTKSSATKSAPKKKSSTAKKTAS